MQIFKGFQEIYTSFWDGRTQHDYGENIEKKSFYSMALFATLLSIPVTEKWCRYYLSVYFVEETFLQLLEHVWTGTDE